MASRPDVPSSGGFSGIWTYSANTKKVPRRSGQWSPCSSYGERNLGGGPAEGTYFHSERAFVAAMCQVPSSSEAGVSGGTPPQPGREIGVGTRSNVSLGKLAAGQVWQVPANLGAKRNPETESSLGRCLHGTSQALWGRKLLQGTRS